LSHILLISSLDLMRAFYIQAFTTSKNAALLIHAHLFLVVL